MNRIPKKSLKTYFGNILDTQLQSFNHLLREAEKAIQKLFIIINLSVVGGLRHQYLNWCGESGGGSNPATGTS